MSRKFELNDDSPSTLIKSLTLYNALINLEKEFIEFKFKGILIRVEKEPAHNNLESGYVKVTCSDNLFIDNLKWASNHKYCTYNKKEKIILYNGFITKVYRKIYFKYLKENRQTKEEKKINKKFNKLVPFNKRILIRFLDLKEIIKNITYRED